MSYRLHYFFVPLIGVFILPGCASTGSAGNSETRNMSYYKCLSAKDEMANDYRSVARVVEVNTGSDLFKTTRICASDGSVLITCSKPDKKMVITRSNHPC